MTTATVSKRTEMRVKNIRARTVLNKNFGNLLEGEHVTRLETKKLVENARENPSNMKMLLELSLRAEEEANCGKNGGITSMLEVLNSKQVNDEIRNVFEKEGYNSTVDCILIAVNWLSYSQNISAGERQMARRFLETHKNGNMS